MHIGSTVQSIHNRWKYNTVPVDTTFWEPSGKVPFFMFQFLHMSWTEADVARTT
jgi:hypothetical protein